MLTLWGHWIYDDTVKPVFRSHSKIDKTKISMTNDNLEILRYFCPALSDNWS